MSSIVADVKTKPVWGNMDYDEFVEYTKTMMEILCKKIIDSVQDVDENECQNDYSTPIEFAKDRLDAALPEELLEDFHEYFYTKKDFQELE